jgi:hypothetical protein
VGITAPNTNEFHAELREIKTWKRLLFLFSSKSLTIQSSYETIEDQNARNGNTEFCSMLVRNVAPHAEGRQ